MLPEDSYNGFTYLFEIKVSNGHATYKPKFRFDNLKFGDDTIQTIPARPVILLQAYSESEFIGDEEED